ncbi:hypothetical protein CJF32_00001587 [Rutstroemia sp. NJR-2017a WRK4]|nr:hypothetical protein CJF32_00001587 [Rutstroemia sp. NJR-2017a WRK4]
MSTPPIPITILTGFLGSGKTTLLLSLIPQLRALNPSYRLALLKNEFGDLAIDSQLASSSAISGVKELLNGCICCNLVGSLGSALEELESGAAGEETKRLDRIVIETSGSAFPATLAMEVNRLSASTGGKYVLDGVITVIDVENWKGYEDTSYTARLQARYTDLVVFNKWEGVGERRWEECLDRLGDLEVQVPWVRSRRGWVDVGVVVGLDGGLRGSVEGEGKGKGEGHEHGHGHEHEHEHDHQSEVEVLSVTLTSSTTTTKSISHPSLLKLLRTAPKDEIYRIKAIFSSSTPLESSDPTFNQSSSSTSTTTSTSTSTPNPSSTSTPSMPSPSLSPQPQPQTYILNWAFGRWTCIPSSTTKVEETQDQPILRMTLVCARDESTKWKKRIEGGGYIELAAEEKKEGGPDAELKVVRLVRWNMWLDDMIGKMPTGGAWSEQINK